MKVLIDLDSSRSYQCKPTTRDGGGRATLPRGQYRGATTPWVLFTLGPLSAQLRTLGLSLSLDV